MLAEGFGLFHWVSDPVHAGLSIVATSGVGYFSHVMWEKLHRKVTGHNAPDTAPPLDWDDSKVAQVYPADALRQRLRVADGTRIVVTDRAGVLQPVDFPTGQYSARQVEERLAAVRVGRNSGAEALQYRTTLFDLALVYRGLHSQDDFFDVEASLSIQVRVDPKFPERLITWRIVTMDRVKSSVDAEIEPHLALAVRSLAVSADDFELRFQERKAELENWLNSRLEQHGLIALITALKARSADFERNRNLLQQLGQEQRRTRIEEMLRQARIEKARGDAAAEEAVKALLQEGHLNDVARMKELEEAQAYRRQIEEAAKVTAKVEQESTGPRHEVLVELAKLRERRKPFSVDLRVVEPGAGSRDIAVHPPAYAVKNQMGSALQLSLLSEIAGYVYVLNLGTSGKLWRLLPNPWRSDNRIAANQTVLVPDGDFELKFEGQPGTEVVMAIVSSTRVDQLERLPVNSDGMSLSPEAAARDIRVVGQHLSGLENWAEATLLIQTDAGRVAGVKASS